jgi:hypothetical protein
VLRSAFVQSGNLCTCSKWVWILLLSLVLFPGMIRAQDKNPPGAKSEGGPQHPPTTPGEQENRGPRGEGQRQPPRPGAFFKRLRELPPPQQRRIMANNPQFQSLPPDVQELVRERLRQWNQMTPQQKEVVREREEIFAGLSPAQRQAARTVFFQYRDLTPPRRQAVAVAFRHLRDLPAGQRRPYLDSQAVKEEFSPHERDILEGLNKLLPGGPAPSPAPEDPEP